MLGLFSTNVFFTFFKPFFKSSWDHTLVRGSRWWKGRGYEEQWDSYLYWTIFRNNERHIFQRAPPVCVCLYAPIRAKFSHLIDKKTFSHQDDVSMVVWESVKRYVWSKLNLFVRGSTGGRMWRNVGSFAGKVSQTKFNEPSHTSTNLSCARSVATRHRQLPEDFAR